MGCLINSRINRSSTELYMEVISVLQPHGGLAPSGGTLALTNFTHRRGEERERLNPRVTLPAACQTVVWVQYQNSQLNGPFRVIR